MAQKITSIFIAVYILIFQIPFVYAQDADAQKKDLEQKIQQYQEKLDSIHQQKNSLSSQIDYMDTQIYLTDLKTKDTENKITQTQQEIETLTTRIEGLDTSIDYLSKLLLRRVVSSYKTKSLTVFDLILDSNNADDLINHTKYMKTVQDDNQKLVLQVQETKLNFEDQKKLREQKKIQLDQLKATLADQTKQLESQKEAKKQLLAVTQNDENVYEKLIEEARRQIAAFKQFVQSTGVNTIPANGLGTGEGGWYYSQRDERWAFAKIGDSNEDVLDVGCFITSITMVMKFYGANVTPLDIASNSRFFSGGPSSACFPTSYGTAYACFPGSLYNGWSGGRSYHNISFSDIASYLNRNIPVIAGVRNGGHYIVLKKVDGNDYIMNDPIYGPDKKVSDYYTISGPLGVFE